MWNYCGLGNLRTKKELGVLVRAKDPSIIFLAETWSDEARLKILNGNWNLIRFLLCLEKIGEEVWCCFGKILLTL